MRLEPGLRAVIQKLDEIFKKSNTRYILIGALVPRILIDLRESDDKGWGIRKTVDVDFAIQVKSWNAYHQIVSRLIASGFEKRNGAPEHRLLYNDISVDIIPYSKELLQEDAIVWPKTGHKMVMQGFDLLFEKAKPEKITESLSIPVIPLSLAVYTKVIAFMDRTASKDLVDIIYMLAHYEEGTVSDRRTDPDIPEEFAFENRGAYLLGKDLKHYGLIEALAPFFQFLNESSMPLISNACRLIRVSETDFNDLMMAFRKGLYTNS